MAWETFGAARRLHLAPPGRTGPQRALSTWSHQATLAAHAAAQGDGVIAGYKMAQRDGAVKGPARGRRPNFLPGYWKRGSRASTSATYCAVSGRTPRACRLTGPS